MTSQRFILHPNGDPQVIQNLYQAITNRDAEKSWEVIIKPYRKNRSLDQNNYYWGVVLPTIQYVIQESRGEHYSTEDLHEWFRDKFLPHRVITIKGETKAVQPSTSKLTIKEFSDYLESIIQFAAESGIVIPDPEWRD